MTTVDGSTQTENRGHKVKRNKFVSKYDIPTSISVFSRDSIFEKSFCVAPEIHLPVNIEGYGNSDEDDVDDSSDENR